MILTRQLIENALEAKQHAYAPYSRFSVGAALLLANGSIVTGANVENASFGLTVCAERSAVFSAVSQGFKDFKGIAIATDSEIPAAPCGACRQVLAEFAPNLPIILTNSQGQIEETTLGELLPRQFHLL